MTLGDHYRHGGNNDNADGKLQRMVPAMGRLISIRSADDNIATAGQIDSRKRFLAMAAAYVDIDQVGTDHTATVSQALNANGATIDQAI